MTNNKNLGRSFVGALVFLMLFFPLYIHAYLEPGTLTYVIQVVVALFVGVMVSLRFFGSKVKEFFRKLMSGKKSGNKEDGPEQE